MGYVGMFCLGLIVAVFISPFLFGVFYFILLALGFVDLTGAPSEPRWLERLKGWLHR